jgi:hypothetical protein
MLSGTILLLFYIHAPDRIRINIEAVRGGVGVVSSRYLDMMRGQRRRPNNVQITARTLLAVLAVVAMAGSAAYWWGVQSQLTNNTIVAVAYTAILVLAPPSLISFLIPWSPAGMLLQKVNARTWAFPVIIGCAAYLLYYSYQIQYSWWAAQPVVADSGLINQQMLIGIIGFVIIPALLWTPVSSDELVEQVRQAHLVRRYELQTQADIAILRATLLRAQEKALIGFANLTVDERKELADAMRGLVVGIDQTLKEIGGTVKTVSDVSLPFNGMLDDNEDIRDVLDYISDSLTGTTLAPTDGEADEVDVADEPDQQRQLSRRLQSQQYDEEYDDPRRTRRVPRLESPARETQHLSSQQRRQRDDRFR